MGFASSTWNGTQDNSLGTAVQARDGYLYVQGGGGGGNLVIGTTTSGRSIKFNAGGPGSANTVARIDANGFSATGNVIAGYLKGEGGNISNIQVGNISGLGNIATINKDGNASNVLYGNGVFAAAGGGSYGNSNVVTLLASYGSNTITTTGNISVGNLNTTGTANSANINMTGGYIGTSSGVALNLVPLGVAGTRVWSKLVPNANLAFSLGSTTEYWANGYVGNVISTTVSATGNVTGGNLITGGIVSATGNITSGNVSATGNITATGTIDGKSIKKTTSSTAPVGPTVGDQWYNSSTDVLYQYVNDGASSYWLDVTGPSFGQTPNVSKVANYVNAGTFVIMDNIKATVTTTGNRGLSIASVSGSFTVNISAWFAYGSSVNAGGTALANGTVNTTPSASLFSWSFPNEGDGAYYVINDKTNGRVYRITMLIGASYLNNFISIERLI
jgi:hypothetical protein